MKKTLQTLSLVAAAGFVVTSESAPGAIPITNFSFEADENTSSNGGFAAGERRDFGGELTGWISQSGTNIDVSVGWRDIPAAQLHPFPAVGSQESQALSLITGGSVLNTTATSWSSLMPGTILNLTISLGMRNVSALNWNEGTFFGITDGDADLATVSLSDTIANSGVIANNPATGTQSGDGTFTDVSFDYTVQASDPLRNGNIGILIYSEGTGGTAGTDNQSFFDNVRLDTVPEPSSTALLALGGLVLLRRRRP